MVVTIFQGGLRVKYASGGECSSHLPTGSTGAVIYPVGAQFILTKVSRVLLAHINHCSYTDELATALLRTNDLIFIIASMG